MEMERENVNPQEARVIEAFRTGVPSTSSVRMLGSEQAEIESAFNQSLINARTSVKETGFLIEAGFGCGKSHLLATLQEKALSKGYACSIVTVSKEMTLANVVDVFANALRELRLPGRSVGGSCAEFIDQLRFDSRSFSELLIRYTDDAHPVDALFGASLQLFERYQSQADVIDSIIDFWDGGRCLLSNMKRDLKAVNLPYLHLRQPAESKMGLARIQFVTNLLIASGMAGWVILIDEGEMIAKLGAIGRARSYTNLASLLGAAGFYNVSGLVAIAAITIDLWRVLLDERNDREVLGRVVARNHPELAEAASRALDFLFSENRRFELPPPDRSDVANLQERLAQIYQIAYPNALTPLAITEDDFGSRNIRSFTKEWITDWDLRRQYPGYEPQLVKQTMNQDLSEDDDYGLTE
jgi:hypothetical protein